MWEEIAQAAYGNEWRGTSRMVVVPTRYGGCYEGGLFAAIPVEALDSAAFGSDCAAASWWDHNIDRVGVGRTPDDAMVDWFKKRTNS